MLDIQFNPTVARPSTHHDRAAQSHNTILTGRSAVVRRILA